MIISMTGYGKGLSVVNEYEAQIEVRSLNHRFLDISAKLPKRLDAYEGAIREIIRDSLERGRVSLTVSLKQRSGQQIAYRLDRELVQGYSDLLNALKTTAGIAEPVELGHLLNFTDIFVQDEPDDLPKDAWQAVQEALRKAVAELNAMRKREGREIEADLLQHLDSLGKLVTSIEGLAEGRVEAEFKRLRSRLEQMMETGDLDQARLELEMALLADKVDIAEECARLRSHIVVFDESVKQPEPAGRKLNFLLQEMNREANTIGAKASHAEIAHQVVKLKEEIEKLREQIQNVE